MANENKKTAKTELQDKILERYVTIAEVLGTMFYPSLEVVVHDLRKPEESIIAIYNGFITNREAGGSATDLGRRLLAGDFPDKLVNYNNQSPQGNKLKSSSLAIRDYDDNLIGVLGVNMDVSYFDRFKKLLDQLTSTRQSPFVDEVEKFNGVTYQEDIKDAIDEYLIANGMDNKMLSNAEKREIVIHLYKKGLFERRRAVTNIAKKLGLSRPSVYSYINSYLKQLSEDYQES